MYQISKRRERMNRLSHITRMFSFLLNLVFNSTGHCSAENDRHLDRLPSPHLRRPPRSRQTSASQPDNRLQTEVQLGNTLAVKRSFTKVIRNVDKEVHNTIPNKTELKITVLYF